MVIATRLILGIALAVAITIALTSCAPRLAQSAPVEGQGFRYVRTAPGEYLVLIPSYANLARVRKSLGCPCIEQRAGIVYLFTVPSKK